MSKLISRQLANEEISKHLQNLKQATATLSGINDQHSKKYFTTPPQSYIFSKADIEQLWKLSPDADGLKIYKASHPDGSPTMVIVACKTSNLNNTAKGTDKTTAANLIGNDNSAALQFPGISNVQAAPHFDISLDNG